MMDGGQSPVSDVPPLLVDGKDDHAVVVDGRFPWYKLPGELQDHVLSFLSDDKKEKIPVIDTFGPNVAKLIKTFKVHLCPTTFSGDMKLFKRCPNVRSLVIENTEHPSFRSHLEVIHYMSTIAAINQMLTSIHAFYIHDKFTCRYYYLDCVLDMDPYYDGSLFMDNLLFKHAQKLRAKHPQFVVKTCLKEFEDNLLSVANKELLFKVDTIDIHCAGLYEPDYYQKLSLMAPNLRILRIQYLRVGHWFKLRHILKLKSLEEVHIQNCWDYDYSKVSMPTIKLFRLFGRWIVSGNKLVIRFSTNLDMISVWLSQTFPQVDTVVVERAERDIQLENDVRREVGKVFRSVKIRTEISK